MLIGFLGNDIVGDMVKFVYLYGIPLVIFIVLYLVTTSFEIHNKINKNTKLNTNLLSIISLKLCIAIAPIFFLDDSFASLLSVLRD